jgi:ProP effector
MDRNPKGLAVLFYWDRLCERGPKMIKRKLLTLKNEAAPRSSQTKRGHSTCSGSSTLGRSSTLSKVAREEKPSPEKNPAPTPNAAKRKGKPNAQLFNILYERFPKCFSSKQKRPLKIGIDQSVSEAAPDLPPRKVKQAIAHYANTPSYLKTLIEGATRIDLAGNAAGVVTADAERHAQERLAEREARR